jgi:hypothetical protein
MRKLIIPFLTLCLSLMADTAFGQKTRFGFTAGASLANIYAKAYGLSVSSDSRIGITAGVLADIPVAAQFSFQPALNYVQKGYKVSDQDYEDKLTLHYIEIPFNFLFKPKMEKVQFFAGAGSSLAYALSGKEKEKNIGNTYTYKYKFGNNPDEHDMKAFDFGANFLTGIQTNGGFVIVINYNLGLSNLAPGDASDEGSIKNRYFGFKIGYMFKEKK